MDKNKRLMKIFVATAGTAAVLVLIAVIALDVWLPRKITAVINDNFGDYVEVGTIAYAFPMGVRADEVKIKKRPGAFLAADARLVKADVRLSALVKLQWDARLLKKVTAQDFTVYVYPVKLPATKVNVAGAPPGVGLTQPVGPAVPLSPAVGEEAWRSVNPGVKPIAKSNKRKDKKINKYDLMFEATGGRVVLKKEMEDNVLLSDVAVSGRCSSSLFKLSGSGKAGKKGTFKIDVDYSRTEKKGKATYAVAVVPAVHVVTFLGKPTFIKEISGEISFTGRLVWGDGTFDHLATGRLAEGQIVLAAREFSFAMEDVRLTFTIHNADLYINEGSCAAALVRWTFGGRAGKLGLDITFKSENMTLSNLLGMVSADVTITYGGKGFAELHIGGTLEAPEFYLRVARTDILKKK